MSCNYADGLSPYHDKGQLGLEERFDTAAVIEVKVDMLAKWINQSKHVVVHTGAGISTSAGIPDFRGPKGVWTLEAKGKKPNSTDFNEAIPTPTHMALTRLVEVQKVKYVVSQNIDGLHLRSGLPRKYLSELHGNMFVEQCNICHRQFVRDKSVPTVGQKNLQTPCPTVKPNGRHCRGRMHDTILDWEHNLPENDLAMADFHSCLADLSIALGTTMQIIPSGSLPLYTKKTGGKLVIINLQPTKHDLKADLIIRGYVDDVINLLLKQLSLKIPKYSPKNDPTRIPRPAGEYLEWTITNETTAEMRRIYENECGSKEAKKRLEVIDEDDIPIADRLIEKPTRKRNSTKLNDSDSDLEVVAEIKKRRGRPRKNPITPPSQSTKLTIKKNATQNKAKYEIVSPRSSKPQKVEIVQYSEDAPCDLEMLCESDNEDPVPITTNFKLYLENDSIFKREDKVDLDSIGENISSEVKKEEDGVNVEPKKEELDTPEKLEESKSDDVGVSNNTEEDINKREEEIKSDSLTAEPSELTAEIPKSPETCSESPNDQGQSKDNDIVGVQNESLPNSETLENVSEEIEDVNVPEIGSKTIAFDSCPNVEGESLAKEDSQVLEEKPESSSIV